MTRELWICLVALAVSCGFGLAHVARLPVTPPTTHPNGVPPPPLNTPIPQDFQIAPTYNQAAGSGASFSYRPLEFQDNGVAIATVHKRGADLVYVVGGKEVGRKEFYRFMDAWLRKNAGIWEVPK